MRPEPPIATLLHTALYDEEGELVEGAFVDHWEWNSTGAVQELAARFHAQGVSDDALAYIRAAMREPATPPTALEWLLRTLGRHFAPIRELVREGLADESVSVRVVTTHAGAHLFDSDALLPLLTDPAPEVRAAVVSVIRDAQPQVIAALDDPAPQVRRAAVAAVRFTGAPEGGDALAARFRVEQDESVRAALLNAVAESTRRAAISDGLPERAGVRAIVGEPIVGLLLEGVRHPDAATRITVAGALQRIPGADAARALLGQLRVEGEPEVRRALVQVTNRNFHSVPDEALPLFTALLAGDPDPALRVAVADQMATFGVEAAAPLLDALDSSVAGVRIAATRALRGAATLRDLPDLLRRLADTDENHRALEEAIYWALQRPAPDPTPEARATVQQLIDALAPDPLREWHIRVCKEELNALPVHSSRALYVWALRPDGELLRLDLDSVRHAAAPEEEPLTRFAAIVQGARPYPVLRDFIPPPPLRTTPCDGCRAIGIVEGEACARCGGLGWRPGK